MRNREDDVLIDAPEMAEAAEPSASTSVRKSKHEPSVETQASAVVEIFGLGELRSDPVGVDGGDGQSASGTNDHRYVGTQGVLAYHRIVPKGPRLPGGFDVSVQLCQNNRQAGESNHDLRGYHRCAEPLELHRLDALGPFVTGNSGRQPLAARCNRDPPHAIDHRLAVLGVVGEQNDVAIFG